MRSTAPPLSPGLVPAALALLLSACATTGSQAERGNWPQFRGPGGLAVADDAPIPTDFGPEARVLWRSSIPPGHSSPCLYGDALFVTGHGESGENLVLALDRDSGRELWRRGFQGEPHPDYSHADAGPALPTPCTDGTRLFVYFGAYGLVALDLGGEVLWEHRLPHPGYGFGVGPSPLLVDDLVILHRDGAPEAALLAFDAADGQERWRVDRFDFVESHGTPFLWRNAERDELIVGGTTRLCSFDPRTGEALWTYAGTTVFPCTTATADAETLYYAAWSTSNASGRGLWEAGFGRSLELSDAEIDDPSLLFRRLDADGDGHVTRDEVPECRAKDAFDFLDRDANGTWEVNELLARPATAPGSNVMVAIARGAEGTVEGSQVRWSWTRGLPYVSSPLLHRGRIWLVKAGGIVTCLDAGTGEPIFGRTRLEDRSEYYASPVGAGSVVLVASAEGTLFLLDAEAESLEVLHSVTFDEELFATPAVVDGTVYLRTKGTLWAFGLDSGA